MKRTPFIGLGALLVLVVGVGLAFASDASPTEEPENSPFFEATLQEAVSELDGRVHSPAASLSQPAGLQAAVYYTQSPNLWPECAPGYTQDLVNWPTCHYTTDPNAEQCETSWPTMDYTWDSTVWPDVCDPTGAGITEDPTKFWCDPTWTHDPQGGPQCEYPAYTRDAERWPWCQPRYTWDPAQWPDFCFSQPPFYTEDPAVWQECDPAEFTTDPYRWPVCHYTSDPGNLECAEKPYPTQDYTSSPFLWPECNPTYTSNPSELPCEDLEYTEDASQWPWCAEDPIPYTTDPSVWQMCHFTSDPDEWPDCKKEPLFPTKDYTLDVGLWPNCRDTTYTEDPDQWPWCDPAKYTTDVEGWPWCDPAWTWDANQWEECQPGYTNDPEEWSKCAEGLYTQQVATWPECQYYTADARIWPECYFTSDPSLWEECYVPWPTQDYTQNPSLWNYVCDPQYTTDPYYYPWCEYTFDANAWPDACTEEKPRGDLGDAPDSSNHSAGVSMTAYPAGGPPGTVAHFPTVFDPATGLPQGPKHWYPRADAWLGPGVTAEYDADVLPDEDGVTNIHPATDTPDQDGQDDGLLYPVSLPHCTRTIISYTVTVAPGAPYNERYVNVWFDWDRDGSWDDAPTCPGGTLAPEWAVQNQVVTMGPGTYVLQTPYFLPYNPDADKPMWMRISIADQPAPTVAGANLPADGQGPKEGYQYGETEDYYFPQEQEPDYDIYIKDSGSDDGSVPSSSPYWISPDIWVRNDGDCTKSVHQNPNPGSTTTVCVRVRNRMATTVTKIQVNVYWASAGLNLLWPGSWNGIGSFNIPSLAGGAEEVKSVTWNVPFITGHFCLLARADAKEDPLPTGPDTIVPVDYVQNNNNIAQKNAHIVAYPEITVCGFYTTTVYTETVFFDAIGDPSGATAVDIEFSSSDFPLGDGAMIVDPGSLWGRWTSLTHFNPVGIGLIPTAFPATMTGIVMGPHETARMTLIIAAQIDEKFTISVKENIGGSDVGGIDYVRNLPRCVYLPIITKEWLP
jgi:hypothetical protein